MFQWTIFNNKINKTDIFLKTIIHIFLKYTEKFKSLILELTHAFMHENNNFFSYLI